MGARSNDTMKHSVTESAAALQTLWIKARRFLEPQLGEDVADDKIRNELDDAEELLAGAVHKVEKALIVCTRRLRAGGRTDAQNSTGSHSSEQADASLRSRLPKAGAPFLKPGVPKTEYDLGLKRGDAWVDSYENRTWYKAEQNPSSHGVKRQYDGVRELPMRPKEARQQFSDQSRHCPKERQHCPKERQQQTLLPVEMLAQIPQEHLVGLLESDIMSTVRKGRQCVASVAAIERKEKVQNLLGVLDPPMELAAFICEKLPHEYTLYTDARGDMVVEQIKRSGPGFHTERKKQLQDDFFATLPQDEFTHEEEEFRAALMRYLDAWQESTPPFLFKALLPGSRLGNELALARYKLMHSDVSVADWICQRTGADFEVTDTGDGVGPRFYRKTDSFRL